MFKNKKGFSLVELITVIAIIAIISGLLAPSLISSTTSSREKTDAASLLNLEMTLQMAFQHSNVYKNAKNIADDTADKKIKVVYSVTGDDNILTLSHCEIVNKNGSVTTSYDDNELGRELAGMRSQLTDRVNGKIEPISIASEQYRSVDHRFIITFLDVDYKVDVELESGEDFAITPSNGMGNPGLNNGAYKEGNDWVLPGNSNIQTHTGQGGLGESRRGDVWKVTVTGENLDEFERTFTYYDGKSWISGGAFVVKENVSENVYEFYFESTVDSPTIACTITNSGSGSSIVHSMQFVNLGQQGK